MPPTRRETQDEKDELLMTTLSPLISWQSVRERAGIKTDWCNNEALLENFYMQWYHITSSFYPVLKTREDAHVLTALFNTKYMMIKERIKAPKSQNINGSLPQPPQ